MDQVCKVYKREVALEQEINQLIERKNELSVELNGRQDSRLGPPPNKSYLARQIKALSAEIDAKSLRLNAMKQSGAYLPMTLSISVISFTANQQEESSPDEPYLVVATVDFSKTQKLLDDLASDADVDPKAILRIAPDISAKLIGPFENVSRGDTRTIPAAQQTVWSSPTKLPLTNINYLSVFIAMMENDRSKPGKLRTFVQNVVGGAALSNLSKIANRDYAAYRKQLRATMQDSVEDNVKYNNLPLSLAEPDDLVGPVQELGLTPHDMRAVLCAGSVTKDLLFDGDGTYHVRVVLKKLE